MRSSHKYLQKLPKYCNISYLKLIKHTRNLSCGKLFVQGNDVNKFLHIAWVNTKKLILMNVVRAHTFTYACDVQILSHKLIITNEACNNFNIADYELKWAFCNDYVILLYSFELFHFLFSRSWFDSSDDSKWVNSKWENVRDLNLIALSIPETLNQHQNRYNWNEY